MAGGVELRDVVAELGRTLPANAIIANGAGNYSAWLHRFYQYRRFRTQLGPTAGSMGFGVPAAVAAKIRHPDRVVVSVNGDGDFLMNGQELATAVHHRLAVVFIVVNNGIYGTIRMHQERHYPGRVHGTDLTNPDFVALARAYGAHGELVTRTAEFPPALARSLEAGKPALIEIRIDPSALSPQFRLKP
jgi:acetolactate synthase-1/2/3 large subunit